MHKRFVGLIVAVSLTGLNAPVKAERDTTGQKTFFAHRRHPNPLSIIFAPKPQHKRSKKTQSGRASWYGGGEKLNRHTASGDRFDPRKFTAAHRTLPFGTKVTVTNLKNGKSVTVTINDYGPAEWTGRIIDLSRGAAQALGMIQAGSIPVMLEIMSDEMR